MRGRGGARGGRGGGAPQQATNTVSIRVSEIQQPVTEDVMRRVFQSVGVTCSNIQITPTNNPQETSVVALFPDTFAAERVVSSLNNRNIFNNGNKMSMQYTNWMPSGTPPAMGAGGGILQGFDGAVHTGAFPPQQMPPQQMPPQQMPPQQMPPQQMPLQQMPQQQMPPQSVFNNMPNPMMQQQAMMGPWNPPFPGQDPYAQNQGFNNERGGMMMRGMRARGRGGRGGFGFDPMASAAMQPGFAPYGPRTFNRGGGAMMMQQQQPNFISGYPQFQQPTVFISVTEVPVTEPLQSIFTLMEAFGGVVTVRRNNSKKEIVTAKATSPEDALAIVTYMHYVPYVGGQVSAKLFPTYMERYPCTDAGDPLNPETTQYDFTASRHRGPAHRSKAVPSRNLKITGCGSYEDADVLAYLSGKGYNPEKVIKSDDGNFEVHFADVVTAVKMLLECQGNVCDEEKSNVIFIEGPRDQQQGGNQQENPQANEQQ